MIAAHPGWLAAVDQAAAELDFAVGHDPADRAPEQCPDALRLAMVEASLAWIDGRSWLCEHEPAFVPALATASTWEPPSAVLVALWERPWGRVVCMACAYRLTDRAGACALCGEVSTRLLTSISPGAPVAYVCELCNTCAATAFVGAPGLAGEFVGGIIEQENE